MRITWKRPSGSTIETNDDPETVKEAEALGWTRKGKAKEDPPAYPVAGDDDTAKEDAESRAADQKEFEEEGEDDLELDQDPEKAKKKKKGKTGDPDWLK